MTKAIEGVTGDIAADLVALRHDVAQLADTMSELVQQQTKAVGSRAAAAAGDASDRIAGTAAAAQTRIRAVGGDLEASIERHPAAALLIAFGVGLSLGMMTRWHR